MDRRSSLKTDHETMTIYPANTPETLNPLLVTTVFGAVALLSCMVRLYTVHGRQQALREEEFFMITALILTYVSLGLQWACVIRGGTGRHVAELILPFEALYGLTLMLVKLAVLRFYSRIFAPSKWFTWAVWVTAAAVVAWMASVVLETFLLCRPLAYNWDASVDGVCGNRNAVFVIAGVTNMVTDFMVLIVPVPCILKLQMPVGQRIGLLLVFGMGVLISAISIVRLRSLMIISFDDATWTLPMGLMWSVLEPELAIINANLPLMHRFFSRMKAKISSLSWSKSTAQSSNKDEFDAIGENGILLRTIGGGYMQRSNIVVGVDAPRVSEGPSMTGIVQQRSIRVDFSDINYGEVGSGGGGDGRARVGEA
ncbi:hypothetical protein KVR01_008139 [Diaporthe batatas]|uniref:uncharacterized protein n=1 Tax=Diaporthe batatas TaxID=748121 RepID=UPI001D04159C|nr:uncharacterized protein KVR01_008139 [Diaporthe batatas]KAG8162374.1 hypothetical protein KVR01_008139 [Diaporthe batatas]